MTHLTAAGLTGSLGDTGAPGQGVNDLASDATPVAHGGGGLPPGGEFNSSTGGAASGLTAADPPGGSPFTPSPAPGLAAGR